MHYPGRAVSHPLRALFRGRRCDTLCHMADDRLLRVVAALWVSTLGAAWLGAAPDIQRMIEGIREPLSAKPGLLLTGALLLASLIVTVVWALRRVPDAEAADDVAPASSGRRHFLAGGAIAVGGVAATGLAIAQRSSGWLRVIDEIVRPKVPLTDPSPRAAWRGARVQSYRRLGRTGFEVSDISLGSGRISLEGGGEDIAREAIDRGVNYFDTAPDYSGSESEQALGRALRGRREQMFLATKFCTPDGHLPAGSPSDAYVRAVEDSLRRLQTDYVDLVHVHACDSVERLLDPRMHDAFEKLREQGKARFLGFSSHTPNLEQVAAAAIEDGRIDVMMLAYHHGTWPLQPELIDRAHAADVGVVAMKTLKGARHHGLQGFREEADAYTQAAFKWVLSNPSVACLVVSFFEQQHLDEYLYASGKAPMPRELALLEKYDQLIAGKHCFAHCGACLEACPHDVPIADVLRHRMYFEDYGTQKLAMQEYARLEQQADVCIGCSAPCTGACPYRVPIQERTSGAHRLLTLG